MKTLAKGIILSLSMTAIGFAMSCGPKGCRDANAVNFDSSAKRDGTCQYTRVIFYAGSNRVGGNATLLDSIEVFQLVVSDRELLGTIRNLQEENPTPSGCTAPATSVVYSFPNGTATDTRFDARYYYQDGSSEVGDTYTFSPDRLTECIVQNLTL